MRRKLRFNLLPIECNGIYCLSRFLQNLTSSSQIVGKSEENWNFLVGDATMKILSPTAGCAGTEMLMVRRCFDTSDNWRREAEYLERKLIPHDWGKNHTENCVPLEMPIERQWKSFISGKAYNRIASRLSSTENCFDPNVTNKIILFAKGFSDNNWRGWEGRENGFNFKGF